MRTSFCLPNSPTNQMRCTVDTLMMSDFEGPPKDCGDRPAKHKHRYTNIDIAKHTPEPPTTSSTLECPTQSVLAIDPNGPFRDTRSRTPRLGGHVPSGGFSPSQWNFPPAERAITFFQSVLVHPTTRHLMRNTNTVSTGFGDS